MNEESIRTRDRWARLRFGVIGPLLAAPVPPGELRAELERLAGRQWIHPTSKEGVRFALSTIERWYYQARNEAVDPVGVLGRRIRSDSGTHPSVTALIRDVVRNQWREHKGWTVQLHLDNLRALAEKDPLLDPLPSYATLRRFMKDTGLVRIRRLGPRGSPGAERAQRRLERLEVRSYEAEFVHGLWHTDFHSGSLKVLTAKGQWEVPQLGACLDDRSRACCHAQWYLAETAENLAHGLSQGIQKRGLPRALMSDCGAAMTAAEVTQGLERLSILHETTLPYSPYQNAKQEVFWAQVEGRLLAMLEGVANDLTLALLNEATQAWVELEYNRKPHSETGEPPIDRLIRGPEVGRPSPSAEQLRRAFTMEKTRNQRRSDGTISVEGVRFEVPSHLRHQDRISVRYARWDLSHVLLVNRHTGSVLERLWPVDKVRNAEGIRRPLDPPQTESPPASGMAPLLGKLMDQYRSSGLPPAYLPKDDSEESR